MNKLIVILALLMASAGQAQVLKNLNYRHLYDPEQPVAYTWRIVKENSDYVLYYELKLTDSLQFNSVAVEFETRESLDAREGRVLSGNHSRLKDDPRYRAGKISFSVNADQKFILSRIILSGSKKTNTLLFHKPLSTAQGVYGKLGDQPISDSYINHQQAVSFSGFEAPSVFVSYYEDAFPAAAPAYSTAQSRVTKTLKPDSMFSIDPALAATFSRKGLYLVQKDTASNLGVAFRSEDDYPRLGKLESLTGPLIYICTKAEYEKIKTAGNDKKKFDQVILSITGNTERARIFMRNYFRRVEAANQYFSSYKEGWKTDRGMVYIIYGAPDEVYLFNDREVWEYKNNNLKDRFQFVKSATIFDPENYVLIRSKSYSNDWFNMIDLWRKARF